jgi:hypothetical protein
MTPFEAVYGVPPPYLLSYIPVTTRVEAVDEVLCNREQIFTLLQLNIKQAHQRMKRYADLRRTERNFEIGQQVYLRTQLYRQSTFAYRLFLKLAPHFYDPFLIIRKVGEVAYELALPPEARVHPVFHVSQLKPKLGSASTALPKLSPVDANGVFQPEPWRCWIVALGRRTTVLSSSCWSAGKANLLPTPLGKNFMDLEMPTHTLWARCFERRGYCHSKDDFGKLKWISVKKKIDVEEKWSCMGTLGRNWR